MEDRIKEIRDFICDVYTGRITSGYSDKALTYCKDLLAALAERDKKITEMTAILETERNGRWSAIQRAEQAEARVRELEIKVMVYEEENPNIAYDCGEKV